MPNNLPISQEFDGEIADEFANNKKLRIFDVNTNKFSGTIPSTLNLASDLQEAKFHENDFTGTVPCNPISFYQDLRKYTSDCSNEVDCLCCSQCF